ncbi:MAG: flagellin [Holosporales bacterium]|jgi:flagellin-like hook-associated protein FlgL
MISLFTNTASLTAQRYSNRNYRSLSHTAAKMASGNRIVKASDDAAGGAIGASLKGNISSLQQAGRNASQGASLLQVADGAIQNMNDILVRMRVLATQVVNDTLSTTERQYAHAEFNQARLQIDQIANGVRWNGAPILNSGARAVASPNTVNTTSIFGTVPTGPFTAANSGLVVNGYVSGPVSAASVTQPGGAGAPYNVSVIIGGQTFINNSVANPLPSPGPLVLTSTTNASNTITFNTTGNIALDTTATFQSNLRTFLGAPMMNFTAGVNTPAVVAAAPFNSLGTVNTAINGMVTAATVAQPGGAGTNYNFSVTIGNETFTATAAENATAGNITFTSTTNLTHTFIMVTAALTPATTTTANLNTFFRINTPANFVPSTGAAYAPTTASTYFAAAAIGNVVGNVIGSAKDVTVNQSGANGVYTIDITIGNQVFRGSVADGADPSSQILFKSLVNDQAGFILTTNQTLPSNNPTGLANDIKTFLQIGGISVPTSFKPGALVGTSAAALLSGNMASTNLSSVVKAGGSVANGIYTLTSSYNATTGAATLRVQGEDGIVYERILDKVSTYTATDTVNVRFFNGFEIALGGTMVASLATDNLGDNVNATGGQANDTVSIVVSQGTANALTFQIGELSTDVIVLTFSPLTADGLGLTPANIETLVGGQKATNILNNAIVLVNNALSEVGAVQNRMDYIQDNIATSVENQSAAKSTFTDADMAAESTEFAKFQALNQAAISMLAQTNRLPQTLLDVLPRG